MKLFYKNDRFTWKNLYLQVEEKKCGTAYEIDSPNLWFINETNECRNVIRLWDEKKYGKCYQPEVSCGEAHHIDLLYADESKAFLYKIEDAVGEEKDIALAIKNLKYLINNVSIEKIRCRVPRIEGYNTENDINLSIEQLKKMGVKDIECFSYKV